LPGRCWLSTDDDSLVALGRQVGIEVPFIRPAALATDRASAVDVALHALDHFSATTGADPQWLLLLQPTSPLRPPAVLAAAWKLAQSERRLDAILGVKAIHRSPSTLYYADDDDVLTPLSGEESESRRQDVRPLLTPNGALYLIRTEVLRRDRTFVPRGTVGFRMDSLVSIDIDDSTDWSLAESVVASGASWRH